jgi:nucleotide-binding universal stress UspA family protein
LYSRILVPHDGSSFAEQVLPHVVEIAKRFEAEIHLLEVITPPNPAVFSSDLEGGAGAPLAIEAIDEAQDELRKQGRERLQSLANSLGEQGIKTVWTVTDGDPAHEIVAYSAKNGIDMIAMASHGRTGFVRAILGSVTDAVLRNAGHPVLVVKASEPS